ncbi:hypothetical protein [Ghiorsea bivora]|uniref:hypothetical protein n=1 Tax=Ghiorsea bivora TaxID=1485545 RepID=UPI0005702DB3|nr:hypothetical protein [Ghiorsea bivora]
MIKQVVVTDAWYEHDGKLLLNPALQAYEHHLLKMKQSWAKNMVVTPLSWYAQQGKQPVAALLAAIAQGLPAGAKQYWVASPFHARLTRTSLRVMPEAMLDWSAQEGQQVCAAVNPLLAEDGLELFMVGDVLMLAAQDVWQVDMPDFAQVSGQSLPNQHQGSKDVGRWLRIITEIQMSLHQHQVFSKEGMQIHGLWFWGQSETVADMHDLTLPHVATRNIYLNTVLKALDKQQHASVIVSEAEFLPYLLPTQLPNDWLLLGAGQAVTLRSHGLTAALAKVKKPTWKGM